MPGVNDELSPATLVTIIATVLVSLRGFKDGVFREKLIFDPYRILAGKEYHRLLSSALLHADLNHLFGNMLTLFFFGPGIEESLGAAGFIVVYLVSILGGDLLSLWMHRHHEYRALGASGGVCGILFAWVLLFPGGSLFLMFIPIPIPGIIYALAYLAYSFVAMKRGLGNVGHDAHIGGSIAGLLAAALLSPASVAASPLLFLTMATIAFLMFLYFWKNPLMLPLKHFLPTMFTPPPKPTPRQQMQRVDEILEKVASKGIHSLTAKERSLLEEASRKR